MAHVEALDAQGRHGEIQRLLQTLQGPGPTVVVGRSLEAMALEHLAGILLHGVHQVPLRSPLGKADLDGSTPSPGEEVFHRLASRRFHRHEDRPGNTGRWIGVEVDEDPAQQFGIGQILDPFEQAGLAADHLATPDMEHLDGGLQLIAEPRHDVEILGTVQLHLPNGIGRPDGGELVPEL